MSDCQRVVGDWLVVVSEWPGVASEQSVVVSECSVGGEWYVGGQPVGGLHS